MLSAIRNRTTPGAVIATLALVFAMTGGAYAAKRFLITSTKQISPSVLKALKGAAGKPGAPGPAGPAGAAGAGTAGAKGESGAVGANGTNGTNGTNGESVTTKAASEAECKEKVGGTAFTVGGKTEHVCNGKNGTTGFTEHLPSGKSETGVWALSELAKASTFVGSVSIPISFAIPLENRLDEFHVHAIGEGEVGKAEEGCGGGSSENPTAEKGNLCVYIQFGEKISPASLVIEDLETGELGAGKTGADTAGVSLPEGASGRGEWVVTAP
jgi:Collagen triple helix repeat (20 copies)